ncbi:MAG: hypothetical protein WC244_02380 [Patescibacteria group bacterium]|jgi:hypothetical protein
MKATPTKTAQIINAARAMAGVVETDVCVSTCNGRDGRSLGLKGKAEGFLALTDEVAFVFLTGILFNLDFNFCELIII